MEHNNFHISFVLIWFFSCIATLTTDCLVIHELLAMNMI